MLQLYAAAALTNWLHVDATLSGNWKLLKRVSRKAEHTPTKNVLAG